MASPPAAHARPSASLTCALAALLLLVASWPLAGCSPKAETPPEDATSSESTKVVGSRMAGPVVDVHVTPEAYASKPATAVLDTPEQAVRSYLDWTSYAYRIGQSKHAKPTMTSYEEVRVDSYVQFNIQKYRLIDQSLTEIEFGKPVIKGKTATISAKEEWTYSYVSIQVAGKVVGGPYEATYETVYHLQKNKAGWVVDSVDAKALGEVK